MWKRIGCVAALVVLAGVVFIFYSLKRAINYAFAQEELGQTHLIVFDVVEAYTKSNGEFPGSALDIETFEYTNGWSDQEWPADSDNFLVIVEPVFSIKPTAENIKLFAPHIDTLPPWAEGNCRASWELILENCEQQTAP